MEKKQIIGILFILILWGCNTKKSEKEKQNEMNLPKMSISHDSTSSGHNLQVMANLTKQELMSINKNLSTQLREDFRSWSYNEPERWKYLADKFADEVIRSCPDALSKKEQIAEIFLNHLNQRAHIINSKSLKKKSQMGTSSTEFKYNLSFLIGIEGYQKWQLLTKNERQKYKAKTDSLNQVISYSNNKFQKPN